MSTIRDKSGRVYQVMDNGARVRVSPQRPWRGKSERRQVIKDRREARQDRAKAALIA